MINLPTCNIIDSESEFSIQSTSGNFRFSAESPNETKDWFQSIQNAIMQSQQNMLNSAFSGLLFRAHSIRLSYEFSLRI